MALTRSDIPDLLLPGLKTEFELAYRSEQENSVAEKIATIINTTQPIQKYAWLGATPPMREFVDERRPTGLAAFAISIEDKVYESTIAVDRKAIEDDQLDLIRLRVRDLASRVSSHRHQITVEALLKGDVDFGYDGVEFFGATHPGPSGTTISNLDSNVLNGTNLSSAIKSMMVVPDDTGTPLGMVPDTLVVGPNLMWTAIELAESPVVVYQGNTTDTAPSTDYTNAFRGRLRVIVSPYIAGAKEGSWFLLDTKRPIKGVILQQRSDVPVDFTALEGNSGSESAFIRDLFLYGVRARYNVGYGLWQAAHAGNIGA